MSVAVELGDGGRGEALRFEREVLELVLPRVFAPGAPFSLSVELPGGAVALSAKTIGSKRLDDGRFDVRVRLTNLRRSERERLVAALA